MIEPTEHELGERIEWFALNTSHTPSSAGRLTRFHDEVSVREEVAALDAVGLPILRVIRRTITDQDVTTAQG